MLLNTKKIKTSEVLSKNYILSKINEIDIFRYYFKNDFQLKKTYPSPLREGDNTPSFNIYFSNNKLLFKDFAYLGGDCFTFVMCLFKESYNEALNRIYNDLILNNSFSKKSTIYNKEFLNKIKLLQFKNKKYSDSELLYWKEHGVTPEILLKFNTYSAELIWLNKILIWKSSELNPIFVYYHPLKNQIKCYRPLEKNKKDKFLSSVTSDTIQGLQQLPEKGDVLIWTKSDKDVLVWDSLGVNAVSPIGENVYVNKDLIINLKSRFKKIIINYDNDSVGKKASEKLSKETGFKEWFIPKNSNTKDISDFRKKYGLKNSLNLIKNIIEW